MAANPKRQLRDLVNGSTEGDDSPGMAAERHQGASAQGPRPLTEADILLTAPVLPEDETADEMITTVRRWRREGGHA